MCAAYTALDLVNIVHSEPNRKYFALKSMHGVTLDYRVLYHAAPLSNCKVGTLLSAPHHASETHVDQALSVMATQIVRKPD